MSLMVPTADTATGVDELRGFAAGVLARAGMRQDEAADMAELLVYAQEVGKNSHGLAHLAAYVRGIETGALRAQPQMRWFDDLAAKATLDADRAPGVLAGSIACAEAARRALVHGIGVVAVRNSAHFGVASAFVERMINQGCAALVFSNASPTVAPRGAQQALLGTNPIAAGFPRTGATPVILDFATTAGSRGAIRKAQAAGELIPPHWALDVEGQPTTDPNAALEGTMQALGGDKGTMLSLMVELLCAGLSGGAPGADALTPQDASAEARGISHLFIAIKANQSICDTVAAIAARIETAPAVNPQAPPRLPGKASYDLRAKSREKGITLSKQVMASLQTAHDIALRISENTKPDNAA